MTSYAKRFISMILKQVAVSFPDDFHGVNGRILIDNWKMGRSSKKRVFSL